MKYLLKNTTDITQPIDAGYAQTLKLKIIHAQERWLEDEQNADKWFNMEQKFSVKEKHIFIIHWIGEAYEDLLKSDFDGYRWSLFEKTGCLMTADGSEDEIISTEGLVEYKVPPPMALLDPQEALSVTVHTEGFETMEIDED